MDPRPPHPHRILVRGVNWLGDAVMTTPALQRLREAQPQAHITLLTHAKLQDLWRHHPAVSETLAFAPGESVLAIARKLRERQFSVALVLPNSPRSAIETWLARIPRRIGYARPWRNGFLTQAMPVRLHRVEMKKRTRREIDQLISRLPGEARPSTFDPRLPVTAHQIHEYLHLATALGANPEPLRPMISVAAQELEDVANRFGLVRAMGGRPLLGLVPGAEYGPAKRWPKENFITAARVVRSRTDCGLVLLGGKADQSLAGEIESAVGPPPGGCRNLAGQTTLRELCAVLKLCDAVLTNDTGPMHVAAAVGTPVVVPFGSTSPELTGPGLPGEPRHRLLKSDAPCAPCFRRECPIDFRCMNGIAVEQVVGAVLEILAARPPA